MTSDPILIRQWYQNVKSRCTCPVCLHDGQPVEVGKVEFHHIDPSTKEESISKLVYGNLVFPDPYTATRVYVEFGKVMPLCPRHHKELHKAEERGEPPRLNLSEDEFYQQQLESFRLVVSRNIPPEIRHKLKV